MRKLFRLNSITLCLVLLASCNPPSIPDHDFGSTWKFDDTYHYHQCECGEKADVSKHSLEFVSVETEPTNDTPGTALERCTVCAYEHTVPYSSVPSKPTNITTNTIGSSIEISWEAPLNNGGLAVDYYEILNTETLASYRETSGDVLNWIKVSEGLSYTFSDLKYDEEYTFWIRAHNEAGYGAHAIVSDTIKSDLAIFIERFKEPNPNFTINGNSIFRHYFPSGYLQENCDDASFVLKINDEYSYLSAVKTGTLYDDSGQIVRKYEDERIDQFIELLPNEVDYDNYYTRLTTDGVFNQTWSEASETTTKGESLLAITFPFINQFELTDFVLDNTQFKLKEPFDLYKDDYLSCRVTAFDLGIGQNDTYSVNTKFKIYGEDGTLLKNDEYYFQISYNSSTLSGLPL